MEFYCIVDQKVAHDICFNSQRDGILRVLIAFAPTARASFNSQRDGILLNFCKQAIHDLVFQFQTGWNSTNSNFFKEDDEVCFNSQQDGILRWKCNVCFL